MINDPFAFDDAAYVLGALVGPERAAFEAHLGECGACRARVAEIRPVAGLLADTPPEAFQAAEPPLPETLYPALRRAVERERRRRRGLIAALAGVAAACAIALAVTLGIPGTGSHGQPTQALSAVAASPVHASVQLTDTAWGTQVRLWCRYDAGYAAGTDYSLVLTDRQGHTHPAGSWRLAPGGVTTFTAGSSLSRAEIARVTITLPDGAPILQLSR